MNCGKIREIIISDYADNELDGKVKAEIEIHLGACPDCREFKEILVSKITGPLRDLSPENPPEYLWKSIKDSIEQRKYVNNTAGIQDLLSFFRPQWINVAVMASMLALTLFTGNYFARGIWGNEPEPEQYARVETEIAANLELNVFDDMPGEHAKNTYDIIRGL